MIQPQDFIQNYSPDGPAELYLYQSDDRKRSGIPGVLQRLRWLLGKMRRQASNDVKAEQAWYFIQARWGEITPATIMCYFEEMFTGKDHLRRFEYSFLIKCLTSGDICKDTIVDIGGGTAWSTVALMLLRFADTQIISVDYATLEARSNYGVRYIHGDCIATGLADGSVDVAANISTLEHIGLGRWGDALDVDGDIKAMTEAWRILKPGGHLILTIPYGYPAVVFNLHRIYDQGRVTRLFQGFEIVLAEYSLLGQPAQREQVEGQKVVFEVPGYYQSAKARIPEMPGGAMYLLRKIEESRS
jgi:SAM-dependent methyltransferase